MANVMTDKIKQIDTGGATSAQTGLRRIRLIQWIDDAGDIADADDLVIVLGGITISMKANIGSDVGRQDNVVWQAGPFNPGFSVSGYSVTTIDHGVLYIWED
jgi:hypothetical protein